jgi:predicted RNase H-like HicB family nuclease
MAKITFTVCITEDDDGSYWSEVKELPGCFASGFSIEELKEATEEAIQLYLPDGIKLGAVKWDPLDPGQSVAGATSSKRKNHVTRRVLVHA